MSEIEINLLGVVDVRLRGAQVYLRRRHAVALLGYLVVTGRPHAREEVAALLGGELSEDSARKLMRNALGDLRQNGLGDFIRADRHTVAFTGGSSAVDVHRLDTVHTQGGTAVTDDLLWGAGLSGVELLSGLSLSDGPEFEEWLRQEREHRRRQAQEIAIRLLNRYESEQQFEEGIRLSRKLLALEPWNEDLHRRLMRFLASNDQIPAAIAQFHACRHLLDEELGTEPQEETLSLFGELTSGPSALRNNLTDLSWTLPGRAVGRDEAVASIIRNLLHADCRLVSVTGLRGSGRSTLVHAVAGKLALPQMFPERHRFADGLFVADLRANALGDFAGGGNEIVERIGIDIGLVFYGNVDPLEHLLSYLAPKRLLLILDNAESIDGDFPIIRSVLGRAPGVSILLTAREPLGIAGEWNVLADGLSLPQTENDLQSSAAGHLLLREAARLHARTKDADRPHLVRMCRLVGGHPVALGILAAWLRVIPASEIVWQLTNAGSILSEPVLGPDDQKMSLNEIVDSDLDRLSQESRHALMRLTVFMGSFGFEAVRAVGVGLDQVHILSRLGVLDCSDGVYVVHPLMRLIGLGRLNAEAELAHEVRSAHADFYAAFVTQQAPYLNQNQDAFDRVDGNIANLFAAWDWSVEQRRTTSMSAMLPGMMTWSELAGRHDEWANVLARSSATLAESLQTEHDIDVHRMVCSLLVAEADAVHWQGEYNRAIRAMMEARRHADAVGDNVLRARVTLRQARILHYQGKEAHVLPLLHEARDLAVSAGDSSLIAFCMMVLSAAHIDYGQFDSAHQALDAAEEAFQALGEPGSISRVLLDRGRAWSISGEFTRARVALEQAIHTSRQYHDKPDEAWATAYLGKVLGDGFGEHGESRERIDRAHALSTEISERMFTSYVYWVDGRNALHIGDFDRARAQLETALEMGRDLANSVTVARVLSSLGQYALLGGDVLPAQSLVDQAIQIARDARRRTTVAAALNVLGQVYEAQQMLDNAATSYMRARRIASVLRMRHVNCDANAGLSRVALTRGQVEQACTFANEALLYQESDSLTGCEDPAWVIMSIAATLDAAGDSRNDTVLKTGHLLLRQRASSLPEDERERYLHATPSRRDLMARVAANASGV